MDCKNENIVDGVLYEYCCNNWHMYKDCGCLGRPQVLGDCPDCNKTIMKLVKN